MANILFIEKSDAYINYLQHFIALKDLNIQPIFTKSAESALLFLETCPASEFPKIICVDLQLNRMCGLQFIRIFKQKYSESFPETYIFISSHLTPEELSVSLEKEIDENRFIKKPITFDQFADKILPLVENNQKRA